jgi:hypothetical protein
MRTKSLDTTVSVNSKRLFSQVRVVGTNRGLATDAGVINSTEGMPYVQDMAIVRVYWGNREQRKNFKCVIRGMMLDYNQLEEIETPKRGRELAGGACPTVAFEVWGKGDDLERFCAMENIVHSCHYALSIRPPGLQRSNYDHGDQSYRGISEKQEQRIAAVNHILGESEKDGRSVGARMKLDAIAEASNRSFVQWWKELASAYASF